MNESKPKEADVAVVAQEASFTEPASLVTPYVSDGANYVIDLLSELQKIAEASGLSRLSKDIGEILLNHGSSEN